MEVYLYQLYALLKADEYNVALLSGEVYIYMYVHVPALYVHVCSVGGEWRTCVCIRNAFALSLQGLLECLLDAFAPLFTSESERCVCK